ncbi:hypothetical protein ACF0H5_013796 [Mactra antiquata]
MANVFLQMCDSMYQIPTRILCLFLVILQGVILDIYLVKHKNIYWSSWIVADIAVILVFVMAFIISYKHLIVAKEAVIKNTQVQTGSLPLGYFAWFVYSGFLAARVAIIFKDFASDLTEEEFFGRNTLKITISLAAFVFMLLLMCHHNADQETDRHSYINELTGTVVFDVLDSVDVLDIMFEQEAIDDFPVHFETGIIVIACVNLILPTLPLMTLSKTHYGNKRAPKEVVMLHKMLLVFLVNLPLLIIRLLLWNFLSEEISIFPVKNLVVIFIVFHDLYEKRRSELNIEESLELEGTSTEMRELQGAGSDPACCLD